MPIYSPYPDVDYPKVSVWDFLFERKSKPFPDDKVIYRDALRPTRLHTYAQTKSLAEAFAAFLRTQWGLRKHDVLAFFSPNDIDIPPATWGAMYAGIVVSPMNPASTTSELAGLLRDCGARGLVTHIACLDTALAAAAHAGIALDRIVLIGAERDAKARVVHLSAAVTVGARAPGLFKGVVRAFIDPAVDTAFLVYSSGTTGLPKGVMLTHENIVSNALMIQATEGGNLSPKGGRDGQGDKVLAFLPFFHIYGISLLIHQPLYMGLETIVMPRFDLNVLCSNIQRHGIAVVYLVPPVVLLLAKHPIVSKYNLSSLKMVMSAAAPLTKDLVVAFYGRLKVPIKQGYGLSETSPGTCLQRWNDWDKGMGSVGVLLPNQTVMIVDDEGREVAEGDVGEIWVKGPNIFKGYLNNEEQTKGCMTPDGYYKTGDIGFVDAAGNFFITDRVKELIKYKGFQVAPAQLEGYLLGHPDIDDVAVIGVYMEEQATEVPRAYVVLRKGVESSRATAEGIVQWLDGKVTNHKRLRGGVRFVKEIPKSTTGKILRRVLRTYVEEEKGAKL